MRHLGSLVLAGVVAPSVYLLAGRGLVRFSDGVADPSDWFTGVGAGVTLGLAGALYALLVVVRLSPVGPVLAGLGYLATAVWALTDPAEFAALVPSGVVDYGAPELTAAAGVGPLLAVPLLLTAFSPRRWRGRDRAAPDADGMLAAPAYPRPDPARPPARTQVMRSGPARNESFPNEYPSDPLRLVYSGPGAPAREPQPPAEETTQVLPSDPPAATPRPDKPTQAMPSPDKSTQVIPPPDEPTQRMPSETPTQPGTSEESTVRLEPGRGAA